MDLEELKISPTKAAKAAEAINFLSSLTVRTGSSVLNSGGSLDNYKKKANSSFSRSGDSRDKKRERLEHATDKAIAALRKVREHRGTGRKAVKHEVASLFSKRVKKGMVWRHKFFCLAFKDQERIPTTEGEKEELYRAGLGEKEITFEDVEMGREEFHESILDAFPRLKEGGGFRFLKGTPNSRHLEVLSMGVHKSPLALKQRVGTSRTYVRPVQIDLDLTPMENEEDDTPMEECLMCGEMLALDKLEEHCEECGKKKTKEEDTEFKIDLTTDTDSELPSFWDEIASYSPQRAVDYDGPLLQLPISQSME